MQNSASGKKKLLIRPFESSRLMVMLTPFGARSIFRRVKYLKQGVSHKCETLKRCKSVKMKHFMSSVRDILGVTFARLQMAEAKQQSEVKKKKKCQIIHKHSLNSKRSSFENATGEYNIRY